MSRTKTTFARRALASVGAAALGLMGVVGLSTSAMAAGAPGTEGAPESGTLTLTKHWEDGSDPGNPTGETLEGVEFTVTQVLKDGAPIDLTDAAGWADAKAVFDSTAPALPDGYTLGTAVKNTTNASGAVSFPLDLGVYLVTETGSGENLISGTAKPFWVSIPMPDEGVSGGFEYHVVAFPKNDPGEFSVDKEATGEYDEVTIGDVLDWEVTFTVPNAPLNYVSLVISDTTGSNHSFTAWGAVTVGATTLVPNTDYEINGADQIVFKQDGLDKINAIAVTEDTPVDVTAVLTTTVTAIPEDGVFSNEASATLNGETEKGGDKYNVGSIKIEKSSSDSKVTDLSGATFALYADNDGEAGHLITTGTTNAAGEIVWNVYVGTGTTVERDFWIKETVALPGHVLPADPWTGPVTVVGGEQAEVLLVQVTNEKPEGPELPLTGANGTMLMTIGGIGLVAVAGGLYLATRRKAHQE